MTRLLSLWRRRRLELTHDLFADRRDPTRPGAARIRDGIPIAHEGPPGFPGRPAVPGDADEPLRPHEARR